MSEGRGGRGVRRGARLALVVCALAAGLLAAWPVRSGGKVVGQEEQLVLPAGMKAYPTPYYTIYTDLGMDDVREVAIRMTRMAEEYHARTSGFSGTIRKRLPFYVFSRPRDYYIAGGLPGSVGVFMSRGQANSPEDQSRLMAIAMESARKHMRAEQGAAPEGGDAEESGTGAETWHVVQHEGFHQFAHAVIGGELPIWVNEGLAEYFGESLFTGDSFVTGIIPPDRLARVKRRIENHGFKSVKDMMLMSPRQWISEMRVTNYDQAWSMVHFLAHGEGGKYQAAFTKFMLDLGHGKDWVAAWQADFGSAEHFEESWSKWWLEQPEDPTAVLYAEATASTLSSFLGRAASQKQKFADLDGFLAAARAHELKSAEADWLPPGLLHLALKSMTRDNTKWSIQFDAAKAPHVVGTMANKMRVVGSFTLNGPHVGKVTVEVDDLPTVVEQAKALIADGKKDQAKALLKSGIARHPRSPSADEARKLMTEKR